MEIILIVIAIVLSAIYFELKKISDYAFKLWLFSENIYKPIKKYVILKITQTSFRRIVKIYSRYMLPKDYV